MCCSVSVEKSNKLFSPRTRLTITRTARILASARKPQAVESVLRPPVRSADFNCLTPLRTSVGSSAINKEQLAPTQKMKIRIEQHTFMGTVWVAAWLFTIGFLPLNFWKGVLAVVLWPYYLGLQSSALAR